MELQALKVRFGIVGHSAGLNHALKVAMQVATTDLSILIFGESGVGKEVFSNIIHKLSLRKHEPFIAINCGAIPEGTIDSELFGHEKGSFTGADKEREGYFEKVDGGTIFLDEIGEMPLGTQARLLRILETGEYIRVGSSVIKKGNVRVLAATNKDLQSQVKKGNFREDLYYRLNTVPIYVPSLHERKEDIPLLFRKFCIDFAAKYHSKPIDLDVQAMGFLSSYRWEGNVRQLKNVAEQLSVLEDSRHVISKEVLEKYLPTNIHLLPSIKEDSPKQSEAVFSNEREILYQLFFDLKKDVAELKNALFHSANTYDAPHSTATPIIQKRVETGQANMLSEHVGTNLAVLNNTLSRDTEDEGVLNIADKEKELIERALKKHNGRKRNAAIDLGISERTLYRKIKDYEIEQ